MTADLHSSYAGWPEAIGIDWERSAWPDFAQTWMGSTMYPTGRGATTDAAAVGWRCPGCSRCYGPVVRQCAYCGPDAPSAAATAPVMGEWDEDS